MKVFALFLLAVVCAVSAELKDSDEVDTGVGPDLDDQLATDDDEKANNRMWNPLKGISAAMAKACSCPNGEKCECGFQIPVLKSKGVVGGRLTEGQIEFNLNIADTIVAAKKFPLSGSHTVCGSLPKPLNTISGCLIVAAIPIPGGVSSCVAVNLLVKDKVGAAVNLQCIDVRGGKVSLGGPGKLTQGGIFEVTVTPPFAALAKKLLG